MFSILTVRSINEDLTRRARIRDAALGRFATEGFAGTSVRSVAADADVSPALVLHYFGSKDGLRSACDDFLLVHIMGSEVPAAGADEAELQRSVQRAMSDLTENRLLFSYLGRMLIDGGTAAERLFDRLVEVTRTTLRHGVDDGTIRSFEDPEVLAVVLTAQGLAQLVLGTHVARALGSRELDTPTIGRMALPLLELYTHGLYTDDTILRAARTAVQPGEQA